MNTEKSTNKSFILYYLCAVALGMVYQLFTGQWVLLFLSSLQITIYGTIAALYNTGKTQNLLLFFNSFSAIFFYLFDDGINGNSAFYLNYLTLLLINYVLIQQKANKNILDYVIPVAMFLAVFALVNFANTPKLVATPFRTNITPLYFLINLSSLIAIGILSIKKISSTSPTVAVDKITAPIENSKETQDIQIKSLIENTANAIWSIDKNFTIIYGNLAFFNTYELLYNRKIEQGQRFFEGENYEDIQYWKSLYERALSGEKFKVEKQLFVNNAYRYVDLSLSPVFNNDEIVGVTINGADITEQIINQKKIIEKEKNLENLIDSLDDIVFEFDENLRYKNIWINGPDKLNHEKEYYIGKTIAEAVSPEFAASLNSALLHTFNTCESTQIDYQHEIKGVKKWFSARTKVVKNQLPKHVLMVVEDINDRKKHEIKTIRQRDFLNKLIETLPVGIFAKDAKNDMIYVLWNKELENMFGILQQDVLGKTDFDIFNIDENIDDYIDTDGMVAQSKEPLLLSNLSINTPNGTIITKTIKVPLLDENNEPDLIIGIIEDITDFQNTQKELEIAEKRWNFALTGSRDGVWDFDLIKDTIYYSPVYKEMLGYSAEEYDNSTLTWENSIHEDDINNVIQSFTDHIYGRTPYYQNEHRKIKKNGSIIWVLDKGKVAEYNEQGKAIRFIGTLTDITSQKELEVKANKTETLLESISQNIKEGIYRVNNNHKVMYANKPFIEMFGYNDFNEVLSIHASEFYHNKADREQFVELIRESNFIENKEIVFKRKDGSTFWGLLSSKRLVDENGDEFFDGAVRDITEIKKIEDLLIKAKEDAEDAAKAKSTFLSTMSHEIRTPMNAVIGITNILLDQQHLPDQVDSLKTLKFSAENLMHLLNDILDFSKIEAGKVELEKTDLNISQLLNEVKQLAEINAKEKGIKIAVDLDTNIPNYLIGDPTRLTQIIFNLVSNAIKFTNEGMVSIKAKLLSTNIENTSIYFEVSDTGIGISEEQVKTIFDQFTQASSDTTRKFGGTGLGLAIIKKLVDLHQSKIYVESQPNMGSKFYFTINFNNNKKDLSEIEANAANKFEPITDMKVLIAEDNKINVFVATKFLKSWGIQFDVAENGKEAIEKASTNVYDLILMDLQMPEMDGFDATLAIRKFNKKIPIYALTANAFSDVKSKVLEVGMNDFITKPFIPAELYKKIKSVKGFVNKTLNLFDS